MCISSVNEWGESPTFRDAAGLTEERQIEKERDEIPPELLVKGRFSLGAFRGKGQCVARQEPGDETPPDARCAKVERCELFSSLGKDWPSQICKHAPVFDVYVMQGLLVRDSY